MQLKLHVNNMKTRLSQPQILLLKGMLRRKIEHFLKKPIQEKLGISEMNLKSTVCIFDFCKCEHLNMHPRLYILFLVDKSMTNGGSKGGGLPCPFLKIEKKYPDFAKKSALILEKCALFVRIYGLNSPLKCNFKSILEKTFSPAVPFFCVSHMKRLSMCPHSKKLPLPRKKLPLLPGCAPALISFPHKVHNIRTEKQISIPS